MKRRIATAVLYAVVSTLGPADTGAATNALDDDVEEESSSSSVLVLGSRGEPKLGAECGGGLGDAGVDGLAGDGAGEPLLRRVSRTLGIPVDAAWVVRTRAGFAAAVAVQGDPHTLVAMINAAVTPATHAIEDGSAALVRLPLARALTHCRHRGYLKVVLTADGAAVASLRSWVEGLGFQFSRARWLDGAPAAEFYTDLYWSGAEPSWPREAGNAA
jgi:hypothetical protein